MSHLIVNEPAFILHTRLFKETSLIVEFITQNHLRVHAVAKGARSQKSKTKYYLQPFLPITISLIGKHELLTLTQIEPIGFSYQLKGHGLLSGLYINELLVKLLRRHHAEPGIFEIYQQALESLMSASNDTIQIEKSLRQFEYELISALGYGFSWDMTADQHQTILPSKQYVFDAPRGFVDCQNWHGEASLVFSGVHLLAIAEQNLQNPTVCRTAKQIMRTAITRLLEGATLRSRELFFTS
jgi:DNA repair protein RecO (recombination protein O)